MRGNLPICMAMGGVSDIQVSRSGARASKNTSFSKKDLGSLEIRACGFPGLDRSFGIVEKFSKFDEAAE
jgi:hypothetical protein